MEPQYKVGDLVGLNLEKKPLGMTVLVDIPGDVFGLEMNREGLIPKIVGRFGKGDVGMILEINMECMMAKLVTGRGLIGWGNTWDFLPVQNPTWS